MSADEIVDTCCDAWKTLIRNRYRLIGTAAGERRMMAQCDPYWRLKSRVPVRRDASPIRGLWRYNNQRQASLVAQRVEQRLARLQIGRIEALPEPAIDRREEIPGVGAFALVAPEPAKAARGPEFP